MVRGAGQRADIAGQPGEGDELAAGRERLAMPARIERKARRGESLIGDLADRSDPAAQLDPDVLQLGSIDQRLAVPIEVILRLGELGERGDSTGGGRRLEE